MNLDCLQLRLYRIMVLFKGLELKVSISLMWVTLTRNFTVSLRTASHVCLPQAVLDTLQNPA